MGRVVRTISEAARFLKIDDSVKFTNMVYKLEKLHRTKMIKFDLEDFEKTVTITCFCERGKSYRLTFSKEQFNWCDFMAGEHERTRPR